MVSPGHGPVGDFIRWGRDASPFENRIKIPEVPEDVDRSGPRRSSPVGIRQPGCYTLVESSEIAQAEGSLPIRRQGRRDDGMEVSRL